MQQSHRRRGVRAITALVAVTALAMVATARVRASDHQDTPEVELNPRMDINDVYAFPGSSPERVVLVMTTSSPIAGSSAAFDPNLLYQFKIDNTGDAIEDRVIQVTFEGTTPATQRFTVRGPVAPAMVGTATTLASGGPVVRGTVGGAVSGDNGIQVFTGLRADPFVIDLEQFFNIVPDRRPSTGPLAGPATPTATAFRTPGVDFLRPFNTLAIVVELPKALLQTSTAADASFGVWGTISR
jgi:Domain of unknown function (DUF4331)